MAIRFFLGLCVPPITRSSNTSRLPVKLILLLYLIIGVFHDIILKHDKTSVSSRHPPEADPGASDAPDSDVERCGPVRVLRGWHVIDLTALTHQGVML